MAFRESDIWQDVAGRTRMVLVTSDDAFNGNLIATAMAAVSNAGIIQTWGSTLGVIAPSAVSATYQAVDDWVPLIFQAADSSQASLTLVAPQSGIFLSDGVTVDPTAIAVLTAACIGHLLTGTGSAVTTFVGGTRRRKLVDYG